MIPFGPFRPDIGTINAPVCLDARNVLPDPVGFRALPALAAGSTNALDGSCLGAAVMLEADGTTHSFAATATRLYKLGTGSVWQDVGRDENVLDQAGATILDQAGNAITTFGTYTSGGGERWQFANFGSLVIAVTNTEDVQKFDVASSVNFTALGGTPPRARYIAIVRDFVVLGCLFGDERTIHWSGINDAEHWTAGTNSSDTQTFPDGGPVRGIIGGETGYVFQAQTVRRMVFVPGSAEIFQFDEVEGGRGLVAPYSLVRTARTAYYLSTDGFYSFDIGAAASAPLGVGKWAQWFLDDLKAGTESLVLGGIDPSQRLVLWAYVPKSSTGQIPTRVLLYRWDLEEATYADISISALSQWLTEGVSLDDLGAFGTLDTLPFSLDSPVWKGGAGILGLFGTDNYLSFLSGPAMEGRVITADGFKAGQRVLISATRPQVDTTSVTVAVAARERDGDTITFAADEALEDTGEVPAHVSGNYARARITVSSGASWAALKGIETKTRARGRR